MGVFGKREPTDDAASQVAAAAGGLTPGSTTVPNMAPDPDTEVRDAVPAPGEGPETVAHDIVVPPANEPGEAPPVIATVTDASEDKTVVRPAIPPLLTDPVEPATKDAAPSAPEPVPTDEVLLAEASGGMAIAPDEPAAGEPEPEPGEAAYEVQQAAEAVEADNPEAPTAISAPANKERIADAAAAARERASEGAAAARDRAAESAAAARERLADGAGEAKERLAEGAAHAKVRGAKMRKRFVEAASDARDMASSAASEARDRAANADVNEFAHSTTRLIDTARPFFLAGFGAVFAILGFLEGDSGTAQFFVAGAILFVAGAAFSGEINAFIHRHRGSDHQPPGPPAGDQ
jgi:hypothetical protein